MGTYSTYFDGELELELTDIISEKINKVISDSFPGVMNLDKQTGILYIKGDVDNSNDKMEKFIKKICHIIKLQEDEDIIIHAQGQDLKDHWDIVIKSSEVYIQEYNLVKAELKLYS